MGRLVVGSRLERHVVDLEVVQSRLLSRSHRTQALAGAFIRGLVKPRFVLAVEALAPADVASSRTASYFFSK